MLKDDVMEIPNAYTFYEKAVVSTERRIEEIFSTEDSVKISGGLAFRREIEILHCFFDTPGDLPSTVSTVNAYIRDDLSDICHSDIQESDLSTKNMEPDYSQRIIP